MATVLLDDAVPAAVEEPPVVDSSRPDDDDCIGCDFAVTDDGLLNVSDTLNAAVVSLVLGVKVVCDVCAVFSFVLCGEDAELVKCIAVDIAVVSVAEVMTVSFLLTAYDKTAEENG